jgi:hypothetical protein
LTGSALAQAIIDPIERDACHTRGKEQAIAECGCIS